MLNKIYNFIVWGPLAKLFWIIVFVTLFYAIINMIFLGFPATR